MRSAKLFVPSGGLDQDSGGDMFSPTQFGFDLSLPAYFLASAPLSLTAEDFNVKSAAYATWLRANDESAIPAATKRTPTNCFTACFLPVPRIFRAQVTQER